MCSSRLVALLLVALALALLAPESPPTHAWTASAALNSNAATDSSDDWYPQVTTDGLGNWVAVWESMEDLEGTIGTDYDILVARSTDDGTTWTDPEALHSHFETDSGDDSYPEVTTDGGGNWVAAWRSDEDLSGIGADSDILVSRSTDNGATWTAPASLNSNAASDSGEDWHPQVTTDSAGNWTAVWQSQDSLTETIGTDWDVLVSRSTDDGATWTAAAALNANAASDTGSDTEPQVANDDAGNWVAVWYSNDDLGSTIGTDGDILVARSTDNGATWTFPAALNTNASTDSGGDGEPQVTTDGANNWVAVWDSTENLGGTIGTDIDILVARSTDNGVTWTAPAALNANAATDTGSDVFPQVTTDAGGNWVAVWESDDELGGTIGIDYDILVARSVDSGATWTDPAALNGGVFPPESGWDHSPQVRTDGAGNWVAAWHSMDSLDGTISSDYDILVARSTDDGATWTEPVSLNTNAATDSGLDQDAQVATDGAGNWVAVWHSTNDLGGTIGTDDDILVARSTDNGATWTDPAALNTNAAIDSGWDDNPLLAVASTGNWVAVWRSAENLDLDADTVGDIGTDTDILFARSTDNGATWSDPAPLNSDADEDTGWDGWGHKMASDGEGTLVETWCTTKELGGGDGTDSDIVFARSTDNGATWSELQPLHPYFLSDQGHDWIHTPVATDGAGNWVTIWPSNTHLGGTIGSDYDILVSHSTDDGATWSEPEALHFTHFSTDSTDETWPPWVASDGAGHWLAVWQSSNNLGGTIENDNDIFVSRSTDNGATWTAPAALNGNAPTDSVNDYRPYVAARGAGKWVAVWDTDGNLGGLLIMGHNVLVSRSDDDGATWTYPAVLNTNAATERGGDAVPAMVNDGAGNWVATWVVWAHLDGTVGTEYDIFYSTCSALDTDCEGVPDSTDTDPLDPYVCQDVDTDTCEDCSRLGFPDPANDGPDNEGDGLCDAGDPDDDNDAWEDDKEASIGTDTLDDCTDQPGDNDAWPPDNAGSGGCGDPDTLANILDVSCYKPKLNYCESEGGYDARYNLEFTEAPGCTPMEQQVNILDVLMYKPVLGTSCGGP